MAAVNDDETSIEYESRSTEISHKENENVIARQVKSAVKKLVANEMTTMVEEALHEVQSKSVHYARKSVRSMHTTS